MKVNVASEMQLPDSFRDNNTEHQYYGHVSSKTYVTKDMFTLPQNSVYVPSATTRRSSDNLIHI